MENLEDEEQKYVLIFDIVGGGNVTITKRACRVFKYTNHKEELCGYKYNSRGIFYPIVNAVTKSWIKDRDISVLLVMNYVTLIYYKEEK